MKKLLPSLVSGTIFALLLVTSINTAFATTSFPDVDENTSYYDAIMWMADNGVISGHPDGSFKPDDCVNRAEMLKMLFLASETDLNDMAMGGLYPDVDPEAWYYEYVKKASIMGIVGGYPDGNFRPEQCVNRVEAIKMGVNQFGLEWSDAAIYGHFWIDIDETAWYFEYFEIATIANVLGLDHTFVGDGISYFPDESMSRKEAAEMLYRMKTVKDNDIDIYYEGMYEPNLIGDQGFAVIP